MCQLVTTDLFDFSTVKCEYSEDERNDLEEAIESVLDNQLLEALFGNTTTIQYEVWL